MHIICTQPNQKEDNQTIFEHQEYVYYKQNATGYLMGQISQAMIRTPADSLDHF
jgi:hypothetical protein